MVIQSRPPAESQSFGGRSTWQIELDEQKSPAGPDATAHIDRALPSWAANSRFITTGPAVFGVVGATVAVLVFREWWRIAALMLRGLAGVVVWFPLYTILMTDFLNVVTVRNSR